MLTPKEFQKAVNAAIQLDTQKPVIDDNGGEYSNESKKRRFITQIKSAKITVSGYGFSWKKSPTITKRVIDGGSPYLFY